MPQEIPGLGICFKDKGFKGMRDTMLEKLSIIVTKDTNPYKNMALEEYLLYHTEPSECILYLWQNSKTVVIGRNQNSWKECHIEELEQDGGFLARRLSGGGAVFHDLGNLNFTFLTRKENYSIGKQTQTILSAVQKFGICARQTGRNDLAVEGRKFSGHAFYETGDFCYHHGTLLIDADKEDMSRYLNPSGEKLKSKGVESVRSRVANLIEYAPRITVAALEEALQEAFPEVYGIPANILPKDRIDNKKIDLFLEKFSSWDWKYGRKIPFTNEVKERFSWGEAQIQLEADKGKIRQVMVYSDALEGDFLKGIETPLAGAFYQGAAFEAAAESLLPKNELQRTMKQDIKSLLSKLI